MEAFSPFLTDPPAAFAWLKVPQNGERYAAVFNNHTFTPRYGFLEAMFAGAAVVHGFRDDGSDVVFTSQKGGRMDRKTFYRLWRRVAERAGLPPHRRYPHTAKFTAGTLLAERGASMAAIRQHLGAVPAAAWW